jgi:ribosome-associated toxin RatA of RatAB toxin-antitoxin module
LEKNGDEYDMVKVVEDYIKRIPEITESFVRGEIDTQLI